MKKWILFFLSFSLFCFAQVDEFFHLMGKESKHWIYVTKPVDLQALERFRTLYEKNKSLRFTQGKEPKIPRVIHVIWLGPNAFPPESVENIRSWMAFHPDWTIKFWTDRERVPPCREMKICDVNEFPFLFLRHCYEESKNWGEKSDILRFEILYQEGGLYIDHDAGCLKNFNGLHQGYDFYCGLEVPHPPTVGRNITTGIGLLGSKPFHPVIGRVIEIVGQRWEELGLRFQGRDGFSRTQLVMQRTYIALTHALMDRLEEEGNKDIVFPAAYFFAKSGIPCLYSKHFFGNTWAQEHSYDREFQKVTRKAFNKLQRRNKNIRLIARGTLAFNLLAFFGALTYIMRRKRR